MLVNYLICATLTALVVAILFVSYMAYTDVPESKEVVTLPTYSKEPSYRIREEYSTGRKEAIWWLERKFEYDYGFDAVSSIYWKRVCDDCFDSKEAAKVYLDDLMRERALTELHKETLYFTSKGLPHKE